MLRHFFEKAHVQVEVDCFTDASEFLKASSEKDYDVVFLDVCMGEKNGMDAAREMREKNPQALLIFVSGFVKYAVRGYRLNAFRYLLKNELEEEIGLCTKEIVQELSRRRRTLCIKTVKGEAVSVLVSDIWYLESQNHNVLIRTANRNYLVHESLNNLCEQVASEDFMRIQRSFYVNLRNAFKVKANRVEFADRTVVTGNRQLGPEIMRRFLEIQGEC